MKITFDVDSVLLKTEERVLEEIYKIYGVNLNLKDISYWNFYKDKYPLVLNFYNDKDYPYLYSTTEDNITRIRYILQGDTRTLLIVPMSKIRYIKFKYTEK